MIESLQRDFRELAKGSYCSLRYVEELSEQLSVRQDVVEPPSTTIDRGVMISVIEQGGLGYAATSDLSRKGLKQAIDRAFAWAERTRNHGVTKYSSEIMPKASGVYRTPVRQSPDSVSQRDKIDLLRKESAGCRIDSRIVDWSAQLWNTHSHQILLTNHGAVIEQHFQMVVPSLYVTAFEDGQSQLRSWGGRYNGFCQQGGMEVLDKAGFFGSGKQTAEEALALLAAPNCPTGLFDVILMPDQMMLQIHESIGHPLELDRILGDERNFAGTSFVTLDMFGSYQYGSDLLNVTYDPSRYEQFASFAFDDEGLESTHQMIIEKGLLLRPLGGCVSTSRLPKNAQQFSPLATTRACSWNRPPIDRMSNLNVEAGASSLEEMIASIDDGMLMKTNNSWSIDDSRNKFQFGCELGYRIRHGKLAELVKNPNYRGISANFWRSLSMVGDSSTLEIMGTPYCGKGEPNQVIRVGHASPACKFSKIDVFGGDA